jgi:hypothetical protein
VIGGLKVTVLVFVASILDVSVFSDVKILGGAPICCLSRSSPWRCCVVP